MTHTNDIPAKVRAWAKGMYPLEAGVELLIRHGIAIYQGAPWIEDLGDRAYLDVDRLLAHSGAWSGGEQRIVRIAASLLGGPPVDLGNELPGLDREGVELVLAAIAHASGSHEHAVLVADDMGSPTGYTVGPSLHPWPDSVRPEVSP